MRKLLSRIAKGQGGFTLIEMIVVVGIIAVLAAVIVPNIGKFIGSGEAGAKSAEWESVQTAMNAMMAETAVQLVTARGTGLAPNANWNGLPTADASDPGALPLVGYLQQASTVYYYCWSGNGQIQEQFENDTTNCS